MNWVFLIVSGFIFLLSPQAVFAQTNSFISVVNPVRGTDFWEGGSHKIDTSVLGQSEILTKFRIPATWLIRFDALDSVGMLKGRVQDEKGLFLEVTPTWAKDAGVEYVSSGSWHAAKSALLTGYIQRDREKLIDAAFEKFKIKFGFYPVSVGSWWIDSYSLEYMQTKYGITGSLVVADQYSTDGYQVWGQYFSTPFYPRKQNALFPASNKDNKIPVVMMQWASRDPINAYGKAVEESTYSVQPNDYMDYHNLDINYFSSLVDLYMGQKNIVNHLVVGLENSYSWEKYGKEYLKEIEVLTKGRDAGNFSVLPMKGFADTYSKLFPEVSPKSLLVAKDPLKSTSRVVWFMNPFYRAGLFFDGENVAFKDVRQYVEGVAEPCFDKLCEQVNFATFATRVLDKVTYGKEWVLDMGEISDFKVTQNSSDVTVSYKNEAGRSRTVSFLDRDIGIDDQVYSIDGAILKALEESDYTVINKSGSDYSDISLKENIWGKSKSLGIFLLAVLFFIYIPGLLIVNKAAHSLGFLPRQFLSCVVGLVSLSLIAYFSQVLTWGWILYAYLAASNILFVYVIYRAWHIPKIVIDAHAVLVLSMIMLGTAFQVIPTIFSGLRYGYGIGFWGPNAHDGVWHLSLVNQLLKNVPPENPVFAGEAIKNYHYLYDILVAATSKLSGLPPADLIFRFYPMVFSFLLGLGSYCMACLLFRKLGKDARHAACFSLFFVYFAGSFGWIAEYLKNHTLSGESAFWSNQSISFNLNPPFAISMVIVLSVIYLVQQLLEKWNTPSAILTALMVGSLFGFKTYGAVLAIISLGILGFVKILQNKDFRYLCLGFTALVMGFLVLLPNYFAGNFQSTISGIFKWSPFWLVHSMVDNPDRLGWTKLSVARQAYLARGEWIKYLTSEALGLVIFVVGNMGMRILGVWFMIKGFGAFRSGIFFLLPLIFFSLSVPLFIIQAGTAWNTIQFLYYGMYIMGIFAGGSMIYLKNLLPSKVYFGLIVFILIATPVNAVSTMRGYFYRLPHTLIESSEMEALEVLKSKKPGVVLTYPFEKSIRSKLAEPIPIFAYDSTSYVSAYTKKSVFIEDEIQNDILQTDYKKRLSLSRTFFKEPDTLESSEFLDKYNIKYVYFVKMYNPTLDLSKKASLTRIYDNSRVSVYQISNE